MHPGQEIGMRCGSGHIWNIYAAYAAPAGVLREGEYLIVFEIYWSVKYGTSIQK